MAESIASKIGSLAGDEFEVVQYFSTSILMNEYAMIYKFAPFVFGVPYTISKSQQVKEVAKNYLYRQLADDIGKFVEKEKPDLCINTNFVFVSSLEKICEEKHIPFLNVLANPGLSHPIEVSNGSSFNLVLDNETKKLLEDKYLDSKFNTTGWFVRPIFEEKYSVAKIKEKLGISPSKPHIFIVSGSEGTSAITKILPSLFRVSDPAVITVACGKSMVLVRQVELLAKVLKKVSPNIELNALSYTKKMHEYMRAADVVVGKAGPNTLFESIATRTPFFAITHVVGQEDINLEIIRDKNLGFVEENILKASKLFEEIIGNPTILKDFERSVDKMARHNSQSGERLLKIIHQLI